MRAIPAIFLLLTACASTTAVPTEWQSVPAARTIRAISLDAAGRVTEAATPQQRGTIRLEGGRLYNGTRLLTGPMEIESFDVSEGRGEVVFSARRTAGFDVGLVSTDGSPISWVPADPADEVMVRWAPRGNKVSYVLRLAGGDAVRTLHIPTAAELTVGFPLATIHALAWDPAGERYAVAYSTPVSSDQVTVVRYGGEEPREAIPPAEKLEVEADVLARDALLLRPRDLGYEEKVPLVVWVGPESGWSDARAALMRRARVACVVTTQFPNDALWTSLGQLPWLDPQRRFVVLETPGAGDPSALPDAVVVRADATLPPGRSRRDGRVMSVSPAVVQSVAAGFIPAQLERNTPTNGSSR